MKTLQDLIKNEAAKMVAHWPECPAARKKKCTCGAAEARKYAQKELGDFLQRCISLTLGKF